MPIFARRDAAAAQQHPEAALRGARRRARELGILEEFWEFVSAGDVVTAMDRLALEELLKKERAKRRRAGVRSTLLIAALCAALCWWLVKRGV
jgi:ferric-dicitrate binding protein FerR (iron transport regulator)